ncbi:beta-L-arabinofuranosidase domain-containing protein [candidate division KSB1 bacterium]
MKSIKYITICVITAASFSLIFYKNYSRSAATDGFLGEKIKYNNINNTNQLCKDYLVNNFNDLGYYTYVTDPRTFESDNQNNMIRQFMASRILATESSHDFSFHSMHKKNLDYIFTYWYEELDDLGYIYFNKKSKLGAIGLALRILVFSNYFEEYKGIAKKLVNTILYLQNEDGSLRPWFMKPENNTMDEDYILTFYSGEAILAMVEYYEKTKEPEVLKATIKSQDYYVDKYAVHLKDNYYPAYVPWHSQSLNKLYKITGDRKYADAIFVMNDELLKIQDTGGLFNKDKYLGRFYNDSLKKLGSPHSSSDAVYTEGLAYAYEIAKMVGDEYHMEKYKRAIILGVHNLMSLQYTGEEAAQYPEPKRVLGGIKYNADDPRIRVDTVQHTVDALTKVLEVFTKEDFADIQ